MDSINPGTKITCVFLLSFFMCILLGISSPEHPIIFVSLPNTWEPPIALGSLSAILFAILFILIWIIWYWIFYPFTIFLVAEAADEFLIRAEDNNENVEKLFKKLLILPRIACIIVVNSTTCLTAWFAISQSALF